MIHKTRLYTPGPTPLLPAAQFAMAAADIHHRTAEFRALFGRYPDASRLLIEADGGGSNDYRKWEWKLALQDLADEFNLVITVTHYPPGRASGTRSTTGCSA